MLSWSCMAPVTMLTLTHFHFQLKPLQRHICLSSAPDAPRQTAAKAPCRCYALEMPSSSIPTALLQPSCRHLGLGGKAPASICTPDSWRPGLDPVNVQPAPCRLLDISLNMLRNGHLDHEAGAQQTSRNPSASDLERTPAHHPAGSWASCALSPCDPSSWTFSRQPWQRCPPCRMRRRWQSPWTATGPRTTPPSPPPPPPW